MSKKMPIHKHDFKASARGYALLVFAIAGFLLVAEIVTFLVRLVMG